MLKCVLLFYLMSYLVVIWSLDGMMGCFILSFPGGSWGISIWGITIDGVCNNPVNPVNKMGPQ